MTLDDKSARRLSGVHPDLQRVIQAAAMVSPLDFIVTEGLRSLERQRQLVAAGASRTMNSRHLTGHAVDLAVLIDRQVRWDWPLYPKLAEVVKVAAKKCGVPVEWGGECFGPKFRDGPHYQLPFANYPKEN